MTCSLLLGIGDSCFNTQVMALLGGMFPDNLGPAFTIFKCIQSFGSSIAFAYAGVVSAARRQDHAVLCSYQVSYIFFQLPLYWQLGLLFSVGTAGTFLFIKIDMESRKKESKWTKKEGESTTTDMGTSIGVANSTTTTSSSIEVTTQPPNGC